MSREIETVSPVLHALKDEVMAMLPLIEARRFTTRWKPDGSPVTDADVFVEKSITVLLGRSFPGITVLGEETFESFSSLPKLDDWIAVLDPIDGTENFCSGLKEWGVSLSLWRGPEHAGSMIVLPELGEHLISGDKPKKLVSRIVGLSSTVSDEVLETLQTIREARITGCAVYNLYNVSRGAFARFINPRGAYSWDLLAGAMLALENGCEVLIDGKVYDGTFLEAGRRYRIDIRHRYDLHSG